MHLYSRHIPQSSNRKLDDVIVIQQGGLVGQFIFKRPALLSNAAAITGLRDESFA
jgi:hypothetical protein